MPEIEIRHVIQDDLSEMIAIDHSYLTDHVLKMELIQEENSIRVEFRNSRLPREMTIQYPRSEEDLLTSWQKSTSILVGRIKGKIVSYIGIEEMRPSGIVKVNDLVVANLNRRHGIASGLILATENWASKRNNSIVILEMQMKNNPMINLSRKLGYSFSGFQNCYFPNHDLALFFEKHIG
ncbi:MAG: GNAT family N-acetyltransferase [Anaerolineaceae bacterium]|nr:GNAT family N-acetyltransferase [Anaerolineaceae bacterium]